MLKYCQNCWSNPRKRAVTNMNLTDVCHSCAMEIGKDIKPNTTEPRSEGVKRYLKAMGVREK